MKKGLLILFTIFLTSSLYAKHIVGGEIIYNYLGVGATPNTKSYLITVRLFRDGLNCRRETGCSELPASIPIGIFYSDTRALVKPVFFAPQTNFVASLPVISKPSCLTNEPLFQYEEGDYSFQIDLPNNAAGFDVTYQTCCRVTGIANGGSDQSATYTTQIPGDDILVNGMTDNSARFQTGISIICYNKSFKLDFSATDPDVGDSLVYMFCDAYKAPPQAQNTSFSDIGPPPYSSISYFNGFSGAEPLGPLATINTSTGIISGIAPDEGKYVVSVCVVTYRDGRYINTHRKDFIVTVAPCDFAGVELKPNFTNCKDSTFTFQNLNTSVLNISFFWDFGDGVTSTEESPTHSYNDTGVYTIKLVVNRGSECADSATRPLRVFPKFIPNFSENSPTCKNVPVQFRDATFATYGPVNSWRWDFGVTTVNSDTSRLQAPTYAYPLAGVYNARLIVGSIKGCLDTIIKPITIVDKPPFTVTNDTLICSVDPLQLSSSSPTPGTVTWSPNYAINDIHSFNPIVHPLVTTTYYVTFVTTSGCSTTDSVKVRVVDFVTLTDMPDTTICRTDNVTLNIQTDALLFTWTPAATLNSATVQNPVATPVNQFTTYHVVGNIGTCTKAADITIKTVPYPKANAGKDTSICFGFNAQLHASGGSIYNWAPPFFLNSTTIPNPISVKPTISLQYIVTVKDTLGCPKPVNDTLLVNVVRIIANAGPRDTAVVIGQPLQLNGTGGQFYQWSPGTWLNNTNIANPISLPQGDIEYALRVSNAAGCFGTDSIRVRFFRTKPDLFVPSAFTPNGDVTNDVFRPIAVGIRSLELFSVYNRWGQLVFTTNQIGKGWDGKFKGATQGTATFVWYAEATDYLGNKIKKKGNVVLVR